MKNVLVSLTKKVSLLLRLTTAASETDAAIQKRIFGSGRTTLIFSKKELDNIMKVVESFEDSGLLIKGVFKKGDF